jgi:AcrR family transcriptional regulator
MSDRVKPRTYHSPTRAEAARQTRHAILRAARTLFLEHGYSATTMTAIAGEAGVAIDTIYASVGPKPLLFRLLLESALSGVDEEVPALEREYVREMQAEPDAGRKLEMYAAAVRSVQERLAPLFRVLLEAAPVDESLHTIWEDISERRASNMRLLVADLTKAAALNPEITPDEAADILWTMNSTEYYTMLVEQRGWSPARFEAWLASAWKRLLLAEG